MVDTQGNHKTDMNAAAVGDKRDVVYQSCVRLSLKENFFIGVDERQNDQLDVGEPIEHVASHVESKADLRGHNLRAVVKDVRQRQCEVGLLDNVEPTTYGRDKMAVVADYLHALWFKLHRGKLREEFLTQIELGFGVHREGLSTYLQRGTGNVKSAVGWLLFSLACLCNYTMLRLIEEKRITHDSKLALWSRT